MSSSPAYIEVYINVYDLLPPGKLSSFLWGVGSGLLHSGVQIENREYAYGGHSKPGVSGVYWTIPLLEPPGAVFRLQIAHGFALKSRDEIDDIMIEESQYFLGTEWNLLSNNCNHFTTHLCQRLTGKAAPTWLNRAAKIGIALPCVLPKDWLTPPAAETVDGERLERDQETDERVGMLRNAQPEPTTLHDDNHNEVEDEEGVNTANSLNAHFGSTGGPRL